MKKIILILVFISPIISCVKQESGEINLQEQNWTFENLEIEIDWKYEINNEKELNDIIEGWIDNLYNVTNRNDDEPIDGFIANFDEDTNILTINPIQNEPDSSCPDGWTNRGVCYSEDCVKEKVAQAFAAELESGNCADVRVVRKTTHARVCSRGC